MKELVKVESKEVKEDFSEELADLLKIMGSMFGPMGGCQFMMGGIGGFEDFVNDLLNPAAPPTPQKVKYDPEIKFSYYGKTGHGSCHNGIIVIASVVNEEVRVIHYGTAFCSPKDVYDKAKGKKLAYDDLCSNMNTVVFRKKTHHEVNAGIFADLIATGAYPSWAKTMVAIQTVKHVKEAMLPKLSGRLISEKRN